MRAHGTYAKYVVERCHCEECRAVKRAYERKRHRENAERAFGARPPVFVDAADTREHLFTLSAAGIGPLQVQRLAGVGKTAQWKIRSRRVLRCRQETEQAVLGITTDDHVFMGSKMDAAPAHAIVRELLEIGHTKAAISLALGNESPALQLGKERVTLRTMRRLEVIHRAALSGVGL
jgi:hypothetical protein